MEAVNTHPAVAAWAHWTSLRRVVQAFATNSAQLEKIIEWPQTDPAVLIAILGEGHDEEREFYYDELYRTLHNFLSILATLIDNARVLANKYKGSEFFSEYESRTLAISQMPVAAFLRDFRNYLVHYRIAPLLTQFAWQNVGEEDQDSSFHIKLDPKQLLKWSGWKADAKGYLRNTSEIVLIDCVREYFGTIMDFYTWMLPHYQLLHREEIADQERQKAHLRELLGLIETDTSEEHRPSDT